MDCGTCETAGPVLVQQPEAVDVELTITQKGYKYVENGQERYIDTQKGWKAVLPKLKEVAEQ